MKISNRNTAVHFLWDDLPLQYIILDTASPETRETTLNFIEKEFPRWRGLFRQKVQYISKPFYTAFSSGVDTLMNLLLKEPVQQCGTFIIPVEGGMMTVFYIVNTKPESESTKVDCCIAIFVNTKIAKYPLADTCLQFWNSNFISSVNASDSKDDIVDKNILRLILGIIIFTKYCEIETKIVPAGKVNFHANEKYVNNTEYPIEILDSTWFTTYILTHGFSVGAKTGGFWRWQPCGPGLSKRKLIWVFPHEKKGYTYKAKAIKERGENIGGQDQLTGTEP